MRAASGRSSDAATVENLQPSGAWPPSSATAAADVAAASRAASAYSLPEMPAVLLPGLYDMGLLFLARFTYGASVVPASAARFLTGRESGWRGKSGADEFKIEVTRRRRRLG